VRNLLVTLALTGGLAACTSVRYEPSRARTASEPGVSVEITEVSTHAVANAFRIELLVDTIEPIELESIRLAPTERTGCSSGMPPSAIEVDGQPLGELTGPISGRRRLTLVYPFTLGPGVLPDQRMSVDLRLSTTGGQRCLRVPFGGEPSERSWDQTTLFSQSYGFELEIPLQPVAGIAYVATVPVKIGRWLGPVRVGLQPGLGGVAVCQKSVCPPDGDDRRAGFVLPLGASVETYFWNPEPWLLGAELRYGTRWVFIERSDGDEVVLIHAPELALQFGIAAPARMGPGFEGGPRRGSFDLELIGGAWSARGETSVVLGGAMSLNLWL
jgi:hypothetical protein